MIPDVSAQKGKDGDAKCPPLRVIGDAWARECAEKLPPRMILEHARYACEWQPVSVKVNASANSRVAFYDGALAPEIAEEGASITDVTLHTYVPVGMLQHETSVFVGTALVTLGATALIMHRLLGAHAV